MDGGGVRFPARLARTPSRTSGAARESTTTRLAVSAGAAGLGGQDRDAGEMSPVG